MSTPEPVITKRKVSMKSIAALPNGQMAEMAVEDYVREDFLEAYLADVRGKWQAVDVSAEPDAGPGGYDGPTFIAAHLDAPEAGSPAGTGTYYPPTPGTEVADDYAEWTAAMVADPNVTVVGG